MTEIFPLPFRERVEKFIRPSRKNHENLSTVPNVKWWFDFGIIYLREDRTRYRPETTPRCVTFRENDTEITIKTRVTDSRIFMLFEFQFQPVSKQTKTGKRWRAVSRIFNKNPHSRYRKKYCPISQYHNPTVLPTLRHLIFLHEITPPKWPKKLLYLSRYCKLVTKFLLAEQVPFAPITIAWLQVEWLLKMANTYSTSFASK